MKVEFFNIDLKAVMIRFYLMMAAVIIGMFSGIAVIAFLAFPLFISTILGVSFSFKKEQMANEVKEMKPRNSMRQAG